MTAVIGAGAFGTALAISLASRGETVTLWARDPEQAREMETQRENARRLPGVSFPNELQITSDLGFLDAEKICLLAVPMQKLRALLNENTEALARPYLVACCKGIELATGLGPVAVIEEAQPGSTAAILTGPSFARDIATGLPTALTLACRDEAGGQHLQQALTTPNLRIYRTDDTVGAQLGGALKNVIAIACGAAIGAGLGESARAAVMTRGYAEVRRMAQALGGRAVTLSGLSGFGDLALTCTSEQSRNYLFGLSIGRGEGFDASITIEGAATARAVAEQARGMALDMPITEVVVALISGKLQVREAMDMLLSRPLKEE